MMALAMALRLLSPEGFMPAFDRGAVTIVACPDAEPMAMAMPMGHHDADSGKAAHQPCPYAAASGAGPLPWDSAVIATPAIDPSPVPAAAIVARLSADRTRQRPPATGPPLLPA